MYLIYFMDVHNRKIYLYCTVWYVVSSVLSLTPLVLDRHHYGRILEEYKQNTGAHTNSSGNTAPLTSKKVFLWLVGSRMQNYKRTNFVFCKNM